MSAVVCADKQPGERQGDDSGGMRSTHYEDELKIVNKRPFDRVSIFLVLVLPCPSFYEGVAYKGIHGGSGGRGEG